MIVPILDLLRLTMCSLWSSLGVPLEPLSSLSLNENTVFQSIPSSHPHSTPRKVIWPRLMRSPGPGGITNGKAKFILPHSIIMSDPGEQLMPIPLTPRPKSYVSSNILRVELVAASQDYLTEAVRNVLQEKTSPPNLNSKVRQLKRCSSNISQCLRLPLTCCVS